ncbi:2-oxoisovalerate dehydrogenase subunit alpha [Trichonephila clavipes]|nr:2-oxoisovalerate dehydrogenase subunit alpha [Trichonephila clavipes]
MAAIIRALPFTCIRYSKYKSAAIKTVSNALHFQRLESTSQQIPKLEEFDKPQFPGSQSRWTEKLEFVRGDIYDGIPVYRVMNRDGNIIDPSHDPKGSATYKAFKRQGKSYMPHQRKHMRHLQ